jgi:hypothetical protein
VAAGPAVPAAAVDVVVKRPFEIGRREDVGRRLEDRPAVERDRKVTQPSRFERREQVRKRLVEVEQVEESLTN